MKHCSRYILILSLIFLIVVMAVSVCFADTSDYLYGSKWEYTSGYDLTTFFGKQPVVFGGSSSITQQLLNHNNDTYRYNVTGKYNNNGTLIDFSGLFLGKLSNGQYQLFVLQSDRADYWTVAGQRGIILLGGNDITSSALAQFLHYTLNRYYNRISTPDFSLSSSGVLTWNNVSNAIQYYIYHDNQFDDRIYITSPYQLSSRGTYYLVASPSNYTLYDDSFAAVINYNNILSSPILTYSSSSFTFYWDSIPNATGYFIFKDGGVVEYTKSSSYTVSSNGSYFVQAISNDDFEPSEPSNIITVNNFGIGGTITPPTPPGEDAGLIDYIVYLVDKVGYFFQRIGNGISNLITGTLDGISNIATSTEYFFESFGDVFAFLPEDISSVLFTIFSIVAILCVLRLFL